MQANADEVHTDALSAPAMDALVCRITQQRVTKDPPDFGLHHQHQAPWYQMVKIVRQFPRIYQPRTNLSDLISLNDSIPNQTSQLLLQQPHQNFQKFILLPLSYRKTRPISHPPHINGFSLIFLQATQRPLQLQPKQQTSIIFTHLILNSTTSAIFLTTLNSKISSN